MLTLDRITLFYHDLREASRAPSDDPLDDVADWAAKVPTRELGTTRTTAPTPSLAGASERTLSSTVAKSSNCSTSRGNIGIRTDTGGEGKVDGLSEYDEADRKESEEACGGTGGVPTKRKGGNSSSVSWNTFFSLTPSHWHGAH
jgi:hypothetical protein